MIWQKSEAGKEKGLRQSPLEVQATSAIVTARSLVTDSLLAHPSTLLGLLDSCPKCPWSKPLCQPHGLLSG